jgi:hypothetical protein
MNEPQHKEARQETEELWGGSKGRSSGAYLFALPLIMLLGALVGGLIGYYSYTPDPNCAPNSMWDAPCDYGAGFDAIVDAFWGGLIGLVVGLITIPLVRGARRSR